MIEANEQYKIFENRLKRFEPVLEKYGYTFLKVTHDSNPALSYNSNSYEYLNKTTGLQINLNILVIAENESVITIVNFCMYSSRREYFSLNEYQESRKPAQIKTQFLDGEDLTSNVDKFFGDLSLAIETYLNDQVIGKAFENHKDKLMDSYYSYSAVYDMQKQVVGDELARREGMAQISLLNRLLKLFKR